MRKATIMIVEADQELKEVIKIRMESSGHKTIMATNDNLALELAQEKRPDIVILDIFLPDMDGLTVLKRMKAPIDVETGKPSPVKDIPIVVITGKAPMIENMTRVEGAADFFVKPIDMGELMKRVNQILEQKDNDKK